MHFTVVYRAICSLFVELTCSPICLLYLLIAVLVYKRRFQSAMQSCVSCSSLCKFTSLHSCVLCVTLLELCNFIFWRKLYVTLYFGWSFVWSVTSSFIDVISGLIWMSFWVPFWSYFKKGSKIRIWSKICNLFLVNTKTHCSGNLAEHCVN
mgnify:FL=1